MAKERKHHTKDVGRKVIVRVGSDRFSEKFDCGKILHPVVEHQAFPEIFFGHTVGRPAVNSGI